MRIKFRLTFPRNYIFFEFQVKRRQSLRPWLDDSKLAALTNSNPVFSVVRKPRFGRIRKIIPSSNGQTPHQQRLRRQAAKEKDTSVFTHEDIQSEFIFYVLRKLDLNESTIDSLEYVLTAPNVQPAFGTLEFMVLPTGTLMAASKSSIDGSVPNSGRKDGPRHDNPPVVPTLCSSWASSAECWFSD